MNQKQSNSLISDAIKERGRIYLEVFRELSKRYGETEAVSVMRSASHARGTAVGKTLAHLGPRDFAGMAECFAKTPDNGVTYSTDVRQLNGTCLEFKNMTCSVKDARLPIRLMKSLDIKVCSDLDTKRVFDRLLPGCFGSIAGGGEMTC